MKTKEQYIDSLGLDYYSEREGETLYLGTKNFTGDNQKAEAHLWAEEVSSKVQVLISSESPLFKRDITQVNILFKL